MVEYLYKHYFKYENKPIKWMWEASEEAAVVSMQFALGVKEGRCYEVVVSSATDSWECFLIYIGKIMFLSLKWKASLTPSSPHPHFPSNENASFSNEIEFIKKLIAKSDSCFSFESLFEF